MAKVGNARAHSVCETVLLHPTLSMAEEENEGVGVSQLKFRISLCYIYMDLGFYNWKSNKLWRKSYIRPPFPRVFIICLWAKAIKNILAIIAIIFSS